MWSSMTLAYIGTVMFLCYLFLDLENSGVISDASPSSDDALWVLFWTLTHMALGLRTLQVLSAAGVVSLTRSETSGVFAAEDGEKARRKELLATVPDERRWLVEDLYKRAERMRRRSTAVLSAIVALIIGGLFWINMAGDLVSGDVLKVTRLEQIQEVIESYEADLEEATSTLSSHASRHAEYRIEARDTRRDIWNLTGEDTQSLLDIIREVNPDAAPLKPTSRKIEDAEEQIAELRRKRREVVREYAELSEKRKIAMLRVTEIKKTLTDLEAKLSGNIDNYLVDRKPEPADRALLVASAITRFGILLVVIFLVQILVGVYRYSLRLAGFYAARADALMARIDPKGAIGDWATVMTPMDIDFGRQPVSPAEHISRLVEAYLQKRADKAEGG